MSFEIDWQSLSPAIATTLTERLNRMLQHVPTPSFLDPIVVQTIGFGDNAPDIQIIDIRDISRAFSQADAQPQAQSADPVFEPNCDTSVRSDAGPYPIDYDGRLPAPTRAPSLDTSFGASRPQPPGSATRHSESHLSNDQFSLDWRNAQPPGASDSQLPVTDAQSSSSSKPSLELHLRVTYSGNMSIDLSTALVLNHPSPLFMSLPVKMRIMGFVFTAELVLAIEADRCRCHCTIFEPELSSEEQAADDFGLEKLAPGARIIPEMLIHTEVGNADKHVLRNVGKVERFLLDTLRRIVCDELLFPTFQTFDWS